MLAGSAYAQTKTTDITQGRYLENTSKDKFVGDWSGSANGSQLKIKISKEKRQFKRGNVNVYLDFLIVKVKKFDLNGNDVHESFKKDISLISTTNDIYFSGVYNDPITKNNINLVLRVISYNKLLLFSSLPDIDPYNHPEKGFVLPKQIELIKQID
jgi:hypothetical protein